MKKLAIVATVVFFLTGFTGNAQMHQGKMQQSNQQQGMMMQGMNCPMHQGMMSQQMPMKKYMMMVNMLPKMHDQLDLSREQTEKLIDMQANFKKQQIDSKAELLKKKMKLQNMLMNDVSSEEVRSQMQECSSIRINMKVAAYETVSQMKAVLTSEQKEQMKEMMMQHQGMMKGGMMQNMENK